MIRITPAHAGKSDGLVTHGIKREDHPRTRGEKDFFTMFFHSVKGSPPHTRGKEYMMNFLPVIIRITPAHAGKSIFTYFLFDIEQDHPRTRGEKLLAYFFTPTGRGSPPHTRGKVISLIPMPHGIGITPAHAGKSHLLF